MSFSKYGSPFGQKHGNYDDVTKYNHINANNIVYKGDTPFIDGVEYKNPVKPIYSPDGGSLFYKYKPKTEGDGPIYITRVISMGGGAKPTRNVAATAEERPHTAAVVVNRMSYKIILYDIPHSTHHKKPYKPKPTKPLYDRRHRRFHTGNYTRPRPFPRRHPQSSHRYPPPYHRFAP